MVKRIAIALNIFGIIAAIGPPLSIWTWSLFHGGEPGSVAVIGGDDGPTAIFITSKISKTGMIILLSAIMVFSFNIFALMGRPK